MKLKKLINEAKIQPPAKDLSKDSKSVTSWMLKNYQELMKQSADLDKLKAYIKKGFKGLSVSDAYETKMFEILDRQRDTKGRMLYLTNALLMGKGLGVK